MKKLTKELEQELTQSYDDRQFVINVLSLVSGYCNDYNFSMMLFSHAVNVGIVEETNELSDYRINSKNYKLLPAMK